MQTGIKLLEDEIIAALKTEIDSIEITPFSEEVKNNDLLSAKNKISVQYTGTAYDTPSNFTPGCIQKERKKFDITIANRDLRSAAGAYELIDKIKVVLFGCRLPSGEKVVFISDDFLDYTAETWIYSIQIEVVTNYIKER